MTATRVTGAMRRSLELRLEDLNARIQALEAQKEGDDNVEATALLLELTRERDQVADALRDAKLIDDEPFDFEATEVGDVVTVRGQDGETESYVLIDDGAGPRARSDWVSVGSPLGAAILGCSKGDSIEIDSPQGRLSYVIVDFKRASEAALASGSGPKEPPSQLQASA